MAHVLARLRNVRLEDIRKKLEEDTTLHAKDGMRLEHLWKNADDQNEILFLFHVEDLDHYRQVMEKTHAEALRQNPDINLPQMILLED